MPWSEQQEKAINTYDKNILVAAAAGSGKTSVLVERVIRRIINRTCDINEILVVTFTNAAASEMRERIAGAITEKLPDKDKERQLVLLNAASISTLHSFCQSIIRQNFHQIELDPKFRLASQQEIDLLKLDVLDDMFERKYDAENNSDFLHFTDTYGNERGDESIYDIVLKLYEYSRSQPFPEQWLKSLPQYFQTGQTVEDIEHCPWFKLIQDEVTADLQTAIESARKMADKAMAMNLPYYVQIGDEDVANLTELLDTAIKSWNDLYTAINDFKFKVMRAPKGTPEDIKDEFKDKRDKVKDILKNLKENYFTQSLDEVMGDMPKLYAQASILCRVTLDFSTDFAMAKAEKSMLDFSDLEHFTLQILADERSTADNLIPTDTAIALQEKYKEIMVDEYQDTNGVQEAILNLIAAHDRPNLFFVGDVKQSIYKFRLAEPELFLQKYNQYPEQKDCERIDLSQNFRSRKEILDGINFIFAQVMTKKAAELSYGEAEALRCGLIYPESISNAPTLQSPIELALFDKNNINLLADTGIDSEKNGNNDESDNDNLDGFNAEALYIVNRLKSLMNESPLVFDKHTKSYRPLKWRDIVILLRSVQDKAMILSEALRTADIPVYASVESGYFQETEVRIMISLLQIIDNPQQDIPLTAVLYSPIVGLTAEELARIRMVNPAGNMYQALIVAMASACRLKKELKQKVADFLQKLCDWRNYARLHSVPELIWLLLDDTGYYDYVGGMNEGQVRQANLRALYDRASTYEQTAFRGLFRFLQFIRKMQNTGNDLAVARSLGESEDVVRIMSIHKSKGLEFPVVILADAGKNFNLTDTRSNVLFHKKLGLGLYVNDLKHHVRYQTLSRQAIASKITHESKAEEMRVLYVAMTRAREKLIITGSVRDIHKFAKHCAGALNEKATLADNFIMNAKSYLDWICPALMRHHDGKILRQWADSEAVSLLNDESKWQISLIDSLEKISLPTEAEQTKQILDRIKKLKPLESTDNKLWVDKRLDWQYPYQETQHIPAKLSVTEIKRRFAEEQMEAEPELSDIYTPREFAFKRPQFLQKQTRMTNVEYGTLLHTVMQHLDFQGDISDNGIKMQLEQMATEEIIAKEQVDKIYRKQIREFLYSDIGTRLRRAVSVERELAFNRMVPTKQFYEEAGNEDTIFVQGIIDLLFEETDGFVLVDYKTDNATVEEAKAKYKIQVDLYAVAAQDIMHRPIKEKYLYLFHSASFVKM